jgi:hypothetical protein
MLNPLLVLSLLKEDFIQTTKVKMKMKDGAINVPALVYDSDSDDSDSESDDDSIVDDHPIIGIARHWKTEAAHVLAIDLQPAGRSATKSCYWANDDSSVPIIIDTGASVSVSPNEADFIGPIMAIPGGKKIEGLNSQVQVEGHGRVRWTVHDKNGCEGTIETQACYIPSASIRLMSPQTCFQEGERGG